MADLEHYQRRIEASLEDLSKLTYNAELQAAQEARVQLELRTFSTGGQGIKDVKGLGLTQYSRAYAKKRQKAGLQTEKKDLIFSSDTSVIKDNITVGLDNNRPALGFILEKGADIAGYQEEYEAKFGRGKIFQLNQEEVQAVKERVSKYVIGQLKEIVQSWK